MIACTELWNPLQCIHSPSMTRWSFMNEEFLIACTEPCDPIHSPLMPRRSVTNEESLLFEKSRGTDSLGSWWQLGGYSPVTPHGRCHDGHGQFIWTTKVNHGPTSNLSKSTSAISCSPSLTLIYLKPPSSTTRHYTTNRWPLDNLFRIITDYK